MTAFRRGRKLRRLLMGLILSALGLPAFLALAAIEKSPSHTRHNIQIAFGFHVNLYHSFRNDTNDESGFGKDIRIIRHIIHTLDRCNADGIPVKGVWDFDNLFSLQEILPQYAPDIIKNIRRRVRENGDEVILMSYNNGLVSAMTPQELDDAVRWSITNPWQSGVQDIFGKYTPIVRPQEMMTTPGSFSVYKKYGIQAVSLYYSATPFDAFRVFTRPLSPAEAHNPILYRNPQTKEEMAVIPTYHIGDLVEHVSLKHWVAELHKLQGKGRLDRDALIFINYDADSELWHGLDLPWLMKWLPNTKGLGALVKEVQGLDYVHFTTIGDYLAHHAPAGIISFSQDTADGSFDGYNSWAEKAEASHYWTVIARNRRVRNAAARARDVMMDALDTTTRLDNLINFSDWTRLRALSTTHFGMATPYVARQREQAMAWLMDELDGYSDALEWILDQGLQHTLRNPSSAPDKIRGPSPLDTILVLQSDPVKTCQGSRFLKISVPSGYKEGMAIALERADGHLLTVGQLVATVDSGEGLQLLLCLDRPEELTDGIYRIYGTSMPRHASVPGSHGASGPSGEKMLANQRLTVQFEKDRIEGVYLDGHRQTRSGSLTPYLR